MKTLIFPLIIFLTATVCSAAQFSYRINGKMVTITGTDDEIRYTRDTLRETCGALSAKEQVQVYLNQATTPGPVAWSDKPETAADGVIDHYKEMLKDKDASLNEWSQIFTKVFKRTFSADECPVGWR